MLEWLLTDKDTLLTAWHLTLPLLLLPLLKTHIRQAVVHTDLQVELIAGVASVELRAGEAKSSFY